jgi:pantetheine-phosphate adenylyltransferase
MKNDKKERSALICGSFDPITKGHLDIVERASRLFDKIYLCAFINPEKSYCFSKDERLFFMKKATAHLPNIVCDYNEGMVCEYLIKNDIDCIVKGIRNANDLEYEEKMAEYNRLHSGKDTLFFFANRSLCDCSSTLARCALKDGSSLYALVPEAICEDVKRAYEKK